MREPSELIQFDKATFIPLEHVVAIREHEEEVFVVTSVQGAAYRLRANVSLQDAVAYYNGTAKFPQKAPKPPKEAK